MNTYRIIFTTTAPRARQVVEADSVNGFSPSSDTYTFKIDGEVIAAVPKGNVISITKVPSGDRAD